MGMVSLTSQRGEGIRFPSVLLGVSSDLFGPQRPFHATDNAPFEIQLSAFVVALESVGDLNTLHRGVDEFPSVFAVGLRESAHLGYQVFERLIRVVDEMVLPPLRIPLIV
jgi:hypothetical protein